MYLINTLLGFAIAQLIAVINRDKESFKNPVGFNLWFFIKDTWFKILLSLLLSFTLSITVHLNFGDFARIFNSDIEVVNNLIYLVIGFAPEKLLQWVRKKYNIL